MQLTKNEEYIIDAIRSLQPFERMEITADKNGMPDTFLVHRSVKVILDREPKFVR